MNADVSKPYKNPVITDVMREFFFGGPNGLTTKYPVRLNQTRAVSTAMLALVSTAVSDSWKLNEPKYTDHLYRYNVLSKSGAMEDLSQSNLLLIRILVSTKIMSGISTESRPKARPSILSFCQQSWHMRCLFPCCTLLYASKLIFDFRNGTPATLGPVDVGAVNVDVMNGWCCECWILTWPVQCLFLCCSLL